MKNYVIEVFTCAQARALNAYLGQSLELELLEPTTMIYYQRTTLIKSNQIESEISMDNLHAFSRRESSFNLRFRQSQSALISVVKPEQRVVRVRRVCTESAKMEYLSRFVCKHV